MIFLIINLVSIYFLLEIKGTGYGSGSSNRETTISNRKNELPKIEWVDSLRVWSPDSEDDEFENKRDDGNYDKRISNLTNDTGFRRFGIGGSGQNEPELKESKGENRNTSGGKIKLSFKKNETVNEESRKKTTGKQKFKQFWASLAWSGEAQNQSSKETMSDATRRTKKSNESAGRKLWFQNFPNLKQWSGDMKSSKYGRLSLQKNNNLDSHWQIEELKRQEKENRGLQNARNALIWSGKLQNVRI